MDMLGLTSGKASAALIGSYDPIPGQPSNPNGYVPAINSYFAGPYIVMVERDQTALDMLRKSGVGIALLLACAFLLAHFYSNYWHLFYSRRSSSD